MGVHAYHTDKERVLKILEKYEIEDKKAKDILDPHMNLPPHLVPPGFNAETDSISYDFTPKVTFLTKVQDKLKTPEWQNKIKNADKLFDIVAASIFIFHLFLQFYCVYYDLLPTWAFVILFLITRTSMAGIGHYHLHRRKDGISDWGDYLFDN